ncbi:hypothetical protein [Empedobacter brevis]|uniref:hypothetical protein n=1 Tax=Empedobacter brevis TaxID=247 RepID=UPI00333EDAB6
MKNKIFIYSLNLLFMISCAQDSTMAQNNKAASWVPYLTKNKEYIYVDRNLKKQLDIPFASASPFLETGYTIVGNQQGKNAVIDSKGNFRIDYTEEEIEVKVAHHLTLMMKELEYEKKMPIWKWDWNIMGGGIDKTQTYKKIEIRVLETNQLLLSKDIPYDEDHYTLNYYSLDEHHFVLNDVLYEIKNKKFKKLKSNLAFSLDHGRYIPDSEEIFSIYTIKSETPLLSNLSGTDRIHLTVNNQLFVLDSLNLDRFSPTVPKILQDSKTKEIYVYPQYDKPFPKSIKQATPKQLAFLKNVDLVYSVNHSPYFILGRFNYDHAIWAYDWLYIDAHGNLLPEIQVKDFYMLDRVGYLIWPDQKMILTKNELDKDWKVDKIKYVYQSENLYIIKTKSNNGGTKEGIWNSDTKKWELEPTYYSVQLLDLDNQIFSLQKEKDDKCILYSNITKHPIGTKSYDSIYSNGLVRITTENKENIYYYIDILTGKEYKE